MHYLISIRLVALLFLAGVYCVSPVAAERYFATSAQPSPVVLARAKRAVVLITTYDQRGKPEKQGSGFFLTADRIVTNYHVVDTAREIRIHTFTGKTVRASFILAADKTSDLALLQLDEPCVDVATLALAEVGPIEGEPVTLISNPLGSPWQVDAGEIGPPWNFFGMGERLQITADVLPGSSGGPVLNLNGNVVGIAVMHVESADNLNFAIPVARLKALQTATAARRRGRTHNLAAGN